MDQWGPYLPERAWGPGAGTEEDTLEEAQSSGAFLDGIFGLTNAGGTASTSFLFWNGRDAQLKERLDSDREILRHGLADPRYRYASCRYRYPHGDAAGGAFDLRWELAKEQATRLYLRVTVVNEDDGGKADQAAADLTLALQVWSCHQECGAIQLMPPAAAGGGGADGGGCLRLTACAICRGQSCLHRTEPQLETGHRLGSCNTSVASILDLAQVAEPPYQLHYPGEGLLHQAPVFSDRARAFDALIVRSDRSQLVEGQTAGCRAAIIYRLRLAPGAKASLSFLLAREDSGPDGPEWAAVPALMARSAELARAALEAGGGGCAGGGGSAVLELQNCEEAEKARRITGRACANLLWNRQLCCGSGTSAPDPCLLVVPDKSHQPGPGSALEHGLHALLLARMTPQLGEAELRNRLAFLTVPGELIGVKASPPAWPIALLELVSLNQPDLTESTERIFMELLRHVNWWLIQRRDAEGRNTMDGGVLGLEQRGWLDDTHSGISNDSLVWSGFLCAKMLHLAALMQRHELKSLLDLFNAVLSSLRNESALVDGLFRPSFAGGGSGGGGGGKETAVTHCYTACSCAFGLTPLLGCATLSWSAVTDKESSVLLEWLQWLSNEAASADSPSLFVKTDTKSNQFLISWISEAEFLQLCGVLFHPDHFLSSYGLRCASKQLCSESGVKDGLCRLTRGRHVVSLPWNFLVLEALKCWEQVYGQRLRLDYPSGSGVKLCLHDIILDISRRLLAIFYKLDEKAGSSSTSSDDSSPAMFYEYYDAETGKGLGGSGQTSWSSLIACVAQNLDRQPTLALHAATAMPRSVGQIVPKSSVVHAFRQSLRCSIKLEDFAPDFSFDWSAEDF